MDLGVDCSQSSIFPLDHRDRALCVTGCHLVAPRAIIPNARPLGTIAVTVRSGISKRSHEKIGDFEQSRPRGGASLHKKLSSTPPGSSADQWKNRHTYNSRQESSMKPYLLPCWCCCKTQGKNFVNTVLLTAHTGSMARLTS